MPRYPPPRWLDYEPIGMPIDGTPLLPVKLPIPGIYSRNIPRYKVFTEEDLFNYCYNRNCPLSGIIDLTFTNYYDPSIFTSRNVRHSKILIEGHAVPNEESVQRFIQEVKNLTEHNPGGLIAIHCTHGVNRTGYLICRYLIDVLGWSPEKALTEFTRARGYHIERENYVTDLLKRQG